MSRKYILKCLINFGTTCALIGIIISLFNILFYNQWSSSIMYILINVLFIFYLQNLNN